MRQCHISCRQAGWGCNNISGHKACERHQDGYFTDSYKQRWRNADFFSPAGDRITVKIQARFLGKQSSYNINNQELVALWQINIYISLLENGLQLEKLDRYLKRVEVNLNHSFLKNVCKCFTRKYCCSSGTGGKVLKTSKFFFSKV